MQARILAFRCGLLLVLAAVAGAVRATDASDPAAALAEAVYNRPDGVDATTRSVMVLTEADREPRLREMYTYRREPAPGQVELLIRFVFPPDIEGTGLLTVDRVDAETDQWIYLPALDRSRRISSSRQGGRFVGSDLYYEDLRDRSVSADRHRLVGKQEINGVVCDVLESVPVDPESSVYGKRVSWIDPATLLPLRMEFYVPDSDTPVKRSEVHRFEKIQGYWTILDSTMTDLASEHQTRITIETIVYDRGLPEELFSRQTLTDPARAIPFRP